MIKAKVWGNRTKLEVHGTADVIRSELFLLLAMLYAEAEQSRPGAGAILLDDIVHFTRDGLIQEWAKERLRK